MWSQKSSTSRVSWGARSESRGKVLTQAGSSISQRLKSWALHLHCRWLNLSALPMRLRMCRRARQSQLKRLCQRVRHKRISQLPPQTTLPSAKRQLSRAPAMMATPTLRMTEILGPNGTTGPCRARAEKRESSLGGKSTWVLLRPSTLSLFTTVPNTQTG